MERSTIEATDENVIKSLETPSFDRSSDIEFFIQTLDQIKGNYFLALDAKWGEGKTFFVRQVEMILKFLTYKKWGELTTQGSEQERIYKSLEYTNWNHMSISKSWFPVYYNAWLYDNHNDPLLSLIFAIAKEVKDIDSRIDKRKISEAILDFADAFAFCAGITGFSKIRRAIKDTGTDIFKEIKTAEEVRICVKNILDAMITEKAQKLLIIVDELDRCRPSFAVEMLERIKHYFDDERIVFLVALNKEQLIHTISRYYGDQFNATKYLDKFFDSTIYLPPLRALSSLKVKQSQVWLRKITCGLSEYFQFSIREQLIFKQQMEALPDLWVNDRNIQNVIFSVFVPIINALDMHDEKEKEKFLSGDSSVLKYLFQQVKVLHDCAVRLSKQQQDEEHDFVEGYKVIETIYLYCFSQEYADTHPSIDYDIQRETKKMCLRMSSGFQEVL